MEYINNIIENTFVLIMNEEKPEYQRINQIQEKLKTFPNYDIVRKLTPRKINDISLLKDAITFFDDIDEIADEEWVIRYWAKKGGGFAYFFEPRVNNLLQKQGVLMAEHDKQSFVDRLEELRKGYYYVSTDDIYNLPEYFVLKDDPKYIKDSETLQKAIILLDKLKELTGREYVFFQVQQIGLGVFTSLDPANYVIRYPNVNRLLGRYDKQSFVNRLEELLEE